MVTFIRKVRMLFGPYPGGTAIVYSLLVCVPHDWKIPVLSRKPNSYSKGYASDSVTQSEARLR